MFFDEITHPNGKNLYSARIIPYRGSWVEFSLDVNDIMYVHIDRKRKLPVTVLLRALGFVSDREILELFYESETIEIKGKKGEAALDRVAAEEVVDQDTGEVLLEANERADPREARALHKAKVDDGSRSSCIPMQDEADVVRNTLKKDTMHTQEEALTRIYNLLRPGEPPRQDSAREILDQAVLQPEALRPGARRPLQAEPEAAARAPAGRQGQAQAARAGHARPRPDDALPRGLPRHHQVPAAAAHGRRGGAGDQAQTDDIDHLGNRRVRSVGELLANQFNIGLARMARIIRERMSLQDAEQVTPYDLINSRTISAVIQSFFGSSQLSQFMDQTNPLAELTHKRRLSALGPGGLTRDRAGFEVRDVHYTHYGRMCPIETPEGPNIGLISSLSTYARVNEFGFLETPYWRVKNGIVDKKTVEFLSADIEGRYRVAPANTPIDKKTGRILGDDDHGARPRRVRRVVARRRPVHGHLADPAGVAGRRADSVPRARRRQPRAHGLEHAAPGGAAPADRDAARRHRPRGQGGDGLRRAGPRPARRHGRVRLERDGRRALRPRRRGRTSTTPSTRTSTSTS